MSPSFVPLRPPEHEMLPFTVIAIGYRPYYKEGASHNMMVASSAEPRIAKKHDRKHQL